MNTKQPGFETIKTAFYRAFVNSNTANFAVLSESLDGKLHPCFPTRKDEFNKELNKWLDLIDIRQAGTIIDILNENKIQIPGWLKNKQFTIEYNQHDFLDLIRLN